MQFKDLWTTLRRRWYLVLVAVAIAAGASALVVDQVGPTYTAQGAVLLIPPGTTVQQSSNSTGSLGNPFLSLSGLNQARDITVQTLSAKTTYEQLCQQEGGSDYATMKAELCKSRPGVTYEVAPDFTSSAPVIVITVKGNSVPNSVTALRVLMDRVPTTLVDLQSGLGLRRRAEIGSIPLVIDNNPDVVHKSQIRAAILAGAGTLGLGLLLIGLLDGTVRSRRRPEQGGSVLVAPQSADTTSMEELDDWTWDSLSEDDIDQSDPATKSPIKPTAGGGWVDVTAARK